MAAVLLLAGCSAQTPGAQSDAWLGRGSNAIPSLAVQEESIYRFAPMGDEVRTTYLVKEQNGTQQILCGRSGCEHGAWDCPAAAWNETVGLVRSGNRFYARSVGAGAVVCYDPDSGERTEVLPAERKAEAFALEGDVLYAVTQPDADGIRLLSVQLRDGTIKETTLAQQDTQVLCTDEIRVYQGVIWLSQTVRTQEGARMRLVRISSEDGGVTVVCSDTAQASIALSGDKIAVQERTQDGYALCLIDAAGGEKTVLSTSSDAVDVIAVQNGFALDRADGASAHTITWIDLAGKQTGSAVLEGLYQPCSGALEQTLYFVHASDGTVAACSPTT